MSPHSPGQSREETAATPQSRRLCRGTPRLFLCERPGRLLRLSPGTLRTRPRPLSRLSPLALWDAGSRLAKGPPVRPGEAPASARPPPPALLGGVGACPGTASARQPPPGRSRAGFGPERPGTAPLLPGTVSPAEREALCGGSPRSERAGAAARPRLLGAPTAQRRLPGAEKKHPRRRAGSGRRAAARGRQRPRAAPATAPTVRGGSGAGPGRVRGGTRAGPGGRSARRRLLAEACAPVLNPLR